MRYLLPFIWLLTLSGCASIISGTTQEMTVNTSPQEAECVLRRDGKDIKRLTTPQTVVIKKTKHDIKITCEKDGYAPVVYMVDSEIQGSAWGNIVLSGGIGWAIDSASGADNEYQEYVNITLSREGELEVNEQNTPAPMREESVVGEDDAQTEDDAACC